MGRESLLLLALCTVHDPATVMPEVRPKLPALPCPALPCLLAHSTALVDTEQRAVEANANNKGMQGDRMEDARAANDQTFLFKAASSSKALVPSECRAAKANAKERGRKEDARRVQVGKK